MRNSRILVTAVVLSILVASAGTQLIDNDPLAPAPSAAQFSQTQPGDYPVGADDSALSLRVNDSYWLMQNTDPQVTILSDPGPGGAPIGRDVTFLAATEQGFVEGWMSSLPQDVVVKDITNTTVADLPALQFDLRPTAGDAIDLLTTAGGTPISFEPGHQYRIWSIETGDRPLVIIVSDHGGGHPFLVQAEALVGTLAERT